MWGGGCYYIFGATSNCDFRSALEYEYQLSVIHYLDAVYGQKPQGRIEAEELAFGAFEGVDEVHKGIGSALTSQALLFQEGKL